MAETPCAERPARLAQYAITLGELGAVSGQTVIVALLPLLLAPYAKSAIWIGFAIGGEGIFALLIPTWVGRRSDRLPEALARPFGRRSFFLLLAMPLMAGSLALAPFLSGYVPLAAAAFVFFAGLHAYLTPLWALMVDEVPDEKRSRVQGVRGVLRSVGLAYGLVAAGLLRGIWGPLPFVLASVLIVLATLATVHAAQGEKALAAAPPENALALPSRAEGQAARWLLVANGLWNGAIDGVRPYVFLFAAAVLGIGTVTTSLALIALVVGLGIGSLIAGRLGDRMDRARLLGGGSLLITVAFALGFIARDLNTAIAVLLLAGVGAACLVALPYPLLASLLGNQRAGQYTGVFVVSVSIGRILAPVFVGAAIDVGRHFLPSLSGYPFMWPAAALLSLLGNLALERSRRSMPREMRG